ncbi:MAG: 30S ribosomal protein S4e [Candidatus Micrarchaeota archaeon]
MAGHGKKRHLKRPNLPVWSRLARKGSTLWLMKSLPGKHSMRESVSLLMLLRDKLSIVENARQARKILSAGEVLVDGVNVKKLGLPVGLMDLVSIPKLDACYRISVSKKGLELKPIKQSDAGVKYCRIVGKTVSGKGKVQLNLHDSRNVLIEKEEDRFKVGDTIVLSIPKQEIKGFLKMEKGAKCLVFKGKHAGKTGVLEEIMSREGSKPSDARLSANGESIITLKDYLMVVDDNLA